MTPATGRVLLHLGRDLRRAVEADDIYYLEASSTRRSIASSP